MKSSKEKSRPKQKALSENGGVTKRSRECHGSSGPADAAAAAPTQHLPGAVYYLGGHPFNPNSSASTHPGLFGQTFGGALAPEGTFVPVSQLPKSSKAASEQLPPLEERLAQAAKEIEELTTKDDDLAYQDDEAAIEAGDPTSLTHEERENAIYEKHQIPQHLRGNATIDPTGGPGNNPFTP